MEAAATHGAAAHAGVQRGCILRGSTVAAVLAAIPVIIRGPITCCLELGARDAPTSSRRS